MLPRECVVLLRDWVLPVRDLPAVARVGEPVPECVVPVRDWEDAVRDCVVPDWRVRDWRVRDWVPVRDWRVRGC